MLKNILNKSTDRALIILAPLIRKLIIRAIRKAEDNGYTFGHNFNEEKVADFITRWLLTGGDDSGNTARFMSSLKSVI